MFSWLWPCVTLLMVLCSGSSPLERRDGDDVDPLVNATDAYNTSWLSFEGSIERGIHDRSRAGYSILNITAQPWGDEGATRASHFEYIEMTLLDPRRRRTARERTFHGYEWHSFPEEKYMPETAPYEPTWYWARQPYTLKGALRQLTKAGVRGPFYDMFLGLDEDDPSVSNLYWQVCYRFYTKDRRDPDRYFGVGGKNGAVYEFRNDRAKIILNENLWGSDSNVTVYKR